MSELTTTTPASKTTKIVFPIVVTIFGGLIAPKGLPLLATIMLGNLLKECGAVSRLTKASENEIANVVTLFLGISIGATMEGSAFLKPQTLIVLALGFVAICLDTVCGVLFGKVMYVAHGRQDQPADRRGRHLRLPDGGARRPEEGAKYNKKNFLLMHAVGANAGGQVGSVMAAAVMLSVLKGMGIIP